MVLTKNFSSIPTQKPGFVFFVRITLGPPGTNFLPAFFDSRIGSYLSTILKPSLSSQINFTLIRNLSLSIASKIELGAETYTCQNMFRIRQCQNLVSELSLICQNPKPETDVES